MGNNRVIIFVIIVTGILLTTLVLIQLAQGYRPDITDGTIKPTGLLVATSIPEGAQVIIDGELETATDDTITLDPKEYAIEIRKDGFIPWRKNLKIFKGLVTQTNAMLFPLVPDLKSLTFTGAINPTLSPGGTRIIYAVPPEQIEDISATGSANLRNLTTSNSKTGLWVLELSDLPLGFSRDPRQVVTGDPDRSTWADAEFIWSPDSREVLSLFYAPEATSSTLKSNTSSTLTTPKLPQKVYRVQLSQTISSKDLTNIVSDYPQIVAEWNEETAEQQIKQLETLPLELGQLIATASTNLKFSPDESKILYTATNSATLANHYIPEVPAASTQPEMRTLEPGNLYVYDIKEDKNFLIEAKIQPSPTPAKTIKPQALDQLTSTLIEPSYQWFPSSNHLIYFQNNQITILEYDNTNRATVYSGSFPASKVFPHPSTSKLIILTSLNPAQSPVPNLYTIVLR